MSSLLCPMDALLFVMHCLANLSYKHSLCVQRTYYRQRKYRHLLNNRDYKR